MNDYWVLKNTASKADARPVYDGRVSMDSDVESVERRGILDVHSDR